MSTSVLTEAGTFLLDASGVCEGVTAANGDAASLARARELAVKCIGAQYVASIDATVPGALVELPRVGASLVFAVVSAEGRVSLLRAPRVVAVATPTSAPASTPVHLPAPVAASAAAVPVPTCGPAATETAPLLADLLDDDESATEAKRPVPPPPTSTAEMVFDIDLAELDV